MLGGGGATFIIYKIVSSFYLTLVIASPIVLLALALAFYKFNDRPFILAIEAAFKYYAASKLFLWKKTGGGTKLPRASNKDEQVIGLPSFGGARMTSDKLKDLSWNLDVHEKMNK